MNNDVINGVPMYLNEPKRALSFLIEKLDFTVHEYAVSKDQASVMICNSYGNFYEVFLTSHHDLASKPGAPVIIDTTDCLKDYYNISQKGLNTSSRPHYASGGLLFEVLDHWNNKYTFLEKRKYDEE